MNKKKVKLAYLQRRKITKKVSELQTICDILESQNKVSSDPEGSNKMVESDETPSLICETKIVSQERIYMEKIAKINVKIEKLKRDNREKEFHILMFGCMENIKLLEDLTVEELIDFKRLVDMKLKEVNDVIAALE
ncbi:uncharacterized protein [Cicer arietinum]|uniref:Agamous-like MADS-box protein AGL80 n=1 Tax=Cicer arietinum TaxID=3827 RepID=A0A1S2Y274_CICAR|nr:agamous-like MADS-box protein AGL80 [Cicer arietinum]